MQVISFVTRTIGAVYKVKLYKTKRKNLIFDLKDFLIIKSITTNTSGHKL